MTDLKINISKIDIFEMIILYSPISACVHTCACIRTTHTHPASIILVVKTPESHIGVPGFDTQHFWLLIPASC